MDIDPHPDDLSVSGTDYQELYAPEQLENENEPLAGENRTDSLGYGTEFPDDRMDIRERGDESLAPEQSQSPQSGGLDSGLGAPDLYRRSRLESHPSNQPQQFPFPQMATYDDRLDHSSRGIQQSFVQQTASYGYQHNQQPTFQQSGWLSGLGNGSSDLHNAQTMPPLPSPLHSHQPGDFNPSPVDGIVGLGSSPGLQTPVVSPLEYSNQPKNVNNQQVPTVKSDRIYSKTIASIAKAMRGVQTPTPIAETNRANTNLDYMTPLATPRLPSPAAPLPFQHIVRRRNPPRASTVQSNGSPVSWPPEVASSASMPGGQRTSSSTGPPRVQHGRPRPREDGDIPTIKTSPDGRHFCCPNCRNQWVNIGSVRQHYRRRHQDGHGKWWCAVPGCRHRRNTKDVGWKTVGAVRDHVRISHQRKDHHYQPYLG